MSSTYTETISLNREKFLKFNSIKFERFQSLIANPHIKRVLNSIPLFLSINHEKCPGYVQGDLPHGISKLFLDEDTKRFLRGKYPNIKTESVIENPFIEMVALIGSVGTIAYNKKSDFDYWVCIQKNSVSAEQYKLFRKKSELVQKWAEAEIELPVHLFINDIESVKNNIYDEDENEAFGSSLGALLKDEFFRSSIVVAGKIPFWWVVPHFATDNEYTQLYEKLSDEDKKEYIDIGNLHKISKEDFMGAALFQIIKSLGNPFKSILKLGVLEKYLYVTGDEPLICQKLKMNILRGNITNTMLDSYLLMFSEVYEYYEKALEDKTLLPSLRQNLYLKIDPQLSKYTSVKDRKNLPYKVEEMLRYTEEWKWSTEMIKDLDNFENWDFTKVMKFWDSVQKFMLLSYQKIAVKFPTMNLQNKISDSDFKLLSRKIKSFFSRESDKIEKFVTFKDTPCEPILYIEPVNQGIREVEWKLYKRNSAETKVFVATTIKTDLNLIKLLVWSALNGIYDPRFSRLTIQSGYTRINQNLVIDMLNSLSNFFSESRMKTKNEYIVKPSFRLINFIILNFNLVKAESISHIVHVYHTSWGESFTKEFSTIDDLAKMLVVILKDAISLGRPYDECCSISSPEPYMKLYKDIMNVFRDAYIAIVENKNSGTKRFISKLGASYLMITREGDEVTGELFPNFIRLSSAISLKPRKSIAYSFLPCDDPFLGTLSDISNMCERNSITIFYEQRGDYIFAYVYNETGNLFIFVRQKQTQDQFLSYLYGFAKNTGKKIKPSEELPVFFADRMRIKLVTVDRTGNRSFRDDTKSIADMYLSKFGYECAYTIIIRRSSTGAPAYNLIFPDRTETGFMPVNNLAAAAAKIDSYKSSGSKIRNFAQDVNMGLSTVDSIKESSVYFLEKYKIEFVIDKLIKK